MGSKSVLILGIVFIFLLNVVAVHNYIDSYYYQPKELNPNEDLFSSISDIFKDVDKEEPKQEVKKIKNEDIKIEKKDTKDTKVEEKPKLKNPYKKALQKPKENLTEYKSSYFNQLAKEKAEREELKEKKKASLTKEKKEVKKEEIIDELEKNAFIVLNLNINDPYEKGNPIIKKIVKRLNKDSVIKIKIYKYSIKMKDYLKTIKDELVDYGVDIDDIKVIYNKDDSKKEKIKILLTKKD